MTEATALPTAPARRFDFKLLIAALTAPRQAFAAIAELPGNAWLTPLTVLMLSALLRVLAAGPIKQAVALSGQAALPESFQYYTPEQQVQFQQAISATSGPVFVYVFPAIIALVEVWAGWMVAAGLLHLVLTLIGGRGSSRTALNLVAWAGLPFAVRNLVQVAYMLFTHSLVASQGLSGFAPADGGALTGFLSEWLGHVDVYLFWHIGLLILGVVAANGLSRGKAIGGVLLTLAILLSLESVPGFILSRLSGLDIIRPFFF